MEEEQKEEVKVEEQTTTVKTLEEKDENYLKLKKSNNRKKALIVILLFTLVLAGILIFLLLCQKEKEEPKKAENNQQEEIPEDQQGNNQQANKVNGYIINYTQLPENSDKSLPFINTQNDFDGIQENIDFLNKNFKLERNINGIKITFTCGNYDKPPFPCDGGVCTGVDSNGERCVAVDFSLDNSKINDLTARNESETCTTEYNIVKSDYYYFVQQRNCSPYSTGYTLYDLSGNIVKKYNVQEVCGKNMTKYESVSYCEENDIIVVDKVVYFSGNNKIYSYLDMSKKNESIVNVD